MSGENEKKVQVTDSDTQPFTQCPPAFPARPPTLAANTGSCSSAALRAHSSGLADVPLEHLLPALCLPSSS